MTFEIRFEQHEVQNYEQQWIQWTYNFPTLYSKVNLAYEGKEKMPYNNSLFIIQ